MSQHFSWWQMPSQNLFRRFSREGRHGSAPVQPGDPEVRALPYDIFCPSDENIHQARESVIKTHINGLLSKLHAAEEARLTAEVREKEAAAASMRAITAYTLFHQKQPPPYGLSRTLKYALIMLVLFIFELPLNAVVFRIFQESEVLTVIFTAGISVVLLLCAHELGKLLRERVLGGKYSDNAVEHRVHGLFITALFVIPLLIIVGIAYARVNYLSDLPEEVALLSPVMIFATFFTVNCAIVLVATLAAYHHYEPYLDAVAQTDSRYQQARYELNFHRGCEDHLKAQLDSAWRIANELSDDDTGHSSLHFAMRESADEMSDLDRRPYMHREDDEDTHEQRAA